MQDREIWHKEKMQAGKCRNEKCGTVLQRLENAGLQFCAVFSSLAFPSPAGLCRILQLCVFLCHILGVSSYGHCQYERRCLVRYLIADHLLRFNLEFYFFSGFCAVQCVMNVSGWVQYPE